MRSFNNKTGYKGVKKLSSGRFQTRLCLPEGNLTLGTYDTVEEASEVYDAFYLKYKGKKDKFFSQIQSKKAKNKQCDNHSGYHGVEFESKTNKFVARVNRNGKRDSLGTYSTAAEAAAVVNRFLDSINDDGPRNDIAISDIIEMQRVKKEVRERQDKYQEELELRTPRIKEGHGPEYKLQQKIISYLMARGWIVKILTAGLYNYGLSDLYATHKRYGGRFIEVKVVQKGGKVNFTPAQYKFFPQFCANGTPIYILTGADEENYQRLFGKSNLWIYMGKLNDGK